MNQAKIYVDFHNADFQGRLRLNATGTIQDLAHYKVWLQEGQNLILYSVTKMMILLRSTAVLFGKYLITTPVKGQIRLKKH